MNEIVSLNGKNFRIWYSTPSERQYALQEAQSQCSACGNRSNDIILSMAPTCVGSKVVGQTLTLTSNPTSGTSPYNYSFYKMIPGSTTPIWLGTQNQASNTLTYTTVTQDITNVDGQLKVGVIVADSCPTGSLQNEESCYVNVMAPCTAPVANLSVT
ncbi:MAG: hypothetical protein PHP08_00320 [Candidatus Dojkabacteria bacterium]|nr:hypothetical protein [Candidatus Dojkabacteria bacterium]